MLCLSQTTGYAILAMSCLSQAVGRLVLAKDIAACTGVPLPYLSKILHALHRSGLIHGKRGYRGGFMLARPPAEVSLLEVAEALEGKNWLPHCLIGLDNCDPEQRCPTHDFWTKERAKIEQELRRVGLNDVAAFARARGLAGVIACDCDDTKTDVRTKVDAGQSGKTKISVSERRVRPLKKVGVRTKRKK